MFVRNNMYNHSSNIANMNCCAQPLMCWNAKDIFKEWYRFQLHVLAYWGGPLYDKEDVVKINFLKIWIGDEGRELFGKFEFYYANDMKNSSLVLEKYEHFCHHHREKNYQLRDGFGGDSEALCIHTGISKAKNDSSPTIDSEPSDKNEMKSNGFEKSHVNNHECSLDFISDDTNICKQTKTKQDSEASKNRFQCVIRKCHQCGNHLLPVVCVKKNKKNNNGSDIKIHTSCRSSEKSPMTSQHHSLVITGDLGKKRCCSEARKIKTSMAGSREGMSDLREGPDVIRGILETGTGYSQYQTARLCTSAGDDSTQQHVYQTERPSTSAGDGPHYEDICLTGDNFQGAAKVNHLYMNEKPPDEPNKSFQQRYDGQSPEKCTSGACETQISSECKKSYDFHLTSKKSDFNVSPGTSSIFSPGTGSRVPPGTGSSVSPGTGSSVSPGTSSSVSPGTGSSVSPGTSSSVTPTNAVAPEPIEEPTHHEIPHHLDDTTSLEDWPQEIIDILENYLGNDGPNNWKDFMSINKIKAHKIYQFSKENNRNRMQSILFDFEKFQNFSIGQLKIILKKMKREPVVQKIQGVIDKHNLNES